MAGVSHSAFRRLVAGFGGYGALYTEMLPVPALLAENLPRSPYTKRRAEEGSVIYQLLITGTASLEKAIKQLLTIAPFGIDINLGCPAPMISRKGGGKALFDDLPRLREVLDTVRTAWGGPLSVKCRLGHETLQWKELFLERLEIFRSGGVDALCVHPRFFHEKLKRRARWGFFSWIKSHWSNPLIGNGDITDATALDLLNTGGCDALMIGREAIRRPWIFQEICGNRVEIGYAQVWDDFFSFCLEDFPPERAIGRIKEFTTYYAENFFFGHELFRRIQSAPDLEALRERAHTFFRTNPKIMSR